MLSRQVPYEGMFNMPLLVMYEHVVARRVNIWAHSNALGESFPMKR